MCQITTQGFGVRNMGAAVWLLLALLVVSDAYPMLSSGKRYQRAWAPYPIIYQPRTTRPYASYYDTYAPDTGDLLDLYYPQDPYEKYRVYQMPQYYYPEQYYYDEEEEPEEPEDLSGYGALPDMSGYGSLQDLSGNLPDAWYNSPNADANAMFLHNLVMAQMYFDATSKNQRYPISARYQKNEDYDQDGEPYVFGEAIRELTASAPPKEDKDVRELKSLVDTGKQRRKTNEGSRKNLEENRWVNKRSESTTSTPSPTNILKTKDKGQDEVVMPRPATQTRQSSFHQRSYQPSAYDAIKKLLIQQNNEGDRQPQKRSYVLNEDSLVEQLGKLKKTS